MHKKLNGPVFCVSRK